MQIANPRGIVPLLAGVFALALTIAAYPAVAAGTPVAPPPSAPSSGYDQPPKFILDVLHAPPAPVPFVSPTRASMLLVSWREFPPMARVATPILKLAGSRIEIANHSKHDTPGGYGITPCATSFELVALPGGASVPVRLPADACPGRPFWAADGKRFAFANSAHDAVELWIGDAATGALRKVPGVSLNPMLDDALQWMPDHKALLVKAVPDHLGAPPAEPAVAAGPSIQDTGGSTGESSTYENRDTLKNKHDEDLFDYYAASQIALVDATTLAVTRLGKPANHELVVSAPDSRHVLVATIHKPYSYVTTHERFPREIEVWDLGKRPAEIAKIASIPLTDRVPVAGVPTGPREFAWRADEPATLVWAEALDGGDWKVKVPRRDKVFLQKAPFDAPPVEVARTEQRFTGFLWTERADTALMEEDDENRHWHRTFVVDVDHPQSAPPVLWDLSSDEKYADPGKPVFRQQADGRYLVRMQGDALYLSGTGASPAGDRPFLDKLDLKTRKSVRLFRSDADSFERFLAFTDDDERRFLTWHQSATTPPNALLRSLGDSAAPIDGPAGEATFASTRVAVTHFPDPTPAVRAIRKRLVTYKRADGVDLSFTLYTPPGYVEGTRVPTILYAYPLDFADASKAGQVSGSQATFTRLRQYQLLLLAGYAIIDRASFPVIGDPRKAYDTYLEQLVADAKAAVDEAVRLGVADPDRIGVTGYSHGALMTVNLLAHSDLFRAGVATSGSYNKTLTPFGFQSERRSVWEAPDVYAKVSPFFVADKIKLPVLIIHGAEDANPGTTPLQATKLYEAIRGNGGTARLVMLPNEPHWYSAMESQEQQIQEMLRWFDQYVKNAPPKAPGA